MKILIEKRGTKYFVGSPCIYDLIYKGDDRQGLITTRYHAGIDCSGYAITAVIKEFNAAAIDFIRYYTEITGRIPNEIALDRIEYIFDESSLTDYWFPATKSTNIFRQIPLGHEKLAGDVLVQDLEDADPNNPFYDKKVVFTGVLENISRNDAAQKVQALGADINNSISKSTNIVIVGKDAGPSKLKKIADYNETGAKIQIVNEMEFLQMIKKHSSHCSSSL